MRRVAGVGVVAGALVLGVVWILAVLPALPWWSVLIAGVLWGFMGSRGLRRSSIGGQRQGAGDGS